MDEVWKAIAGLEGRYEVSNLGRVRSLPRVTHYTKENGKKIAERLQGRILRTRPASVGYPQVWLPGGRRMCSVRALVAEAFGEER